MGTTPQTVSSQKYHADDNGDEFNFQIKNNPPKIERRQHTAKNLNKLQLKANNPSGESVEELMG